MINLDGFFTSRIDFCTECGDFALSLCLSPLDTVYNFQLMEINGPDNLFDIKFVPGWHSEFLPSFAFYINFLSQQSLDRHKARVFCTIPSRGFILKRQKQRGKTWIRQININGVKWSSPTPPATLYPRPRYNLLALVDFQNPVQHIRVSSSYRGLSRSGLGRLV